MKKRMQSSYSELIDCSVLCPKQEFFTYMETSGRYLYRATPAVTRDLGFPVSSKEPPHPAVYYDT
jgi:hypothetical protein